MKFWDSSAVIPLLVPERTSQSVQKVFDGDPVIVVWWATELECTSAIARRRRRGQIREELVLEGVRRLNALRAGWHEVEPSEEIRESATRLLRVHDLRTADALQLAAAFFVAEARPSTLEFITLDERLLAASRREGFSVSKPTP